MNLVRLRARLLARALTRCTPAGLPVVEATFQYLGQVAEARVERTLEFEFEALALGETAQRIDGEALGTEVQLEGFLAPRSRRSRRLRIHITDYVRVHGD